MCWNGNGSGVYKQDLGLRALTKQGVTRKPTPSTVDVNTILLNSLEQFYPIITSAPLPVFKYAISVYLTKLRHLFDILNNSTSKALL